MLKNVQFMRKYKHISSSDQCRTTKFVKFVLLFEVQNTFYYLNVFWLQLMMNISQKDLKKLETFELPSPTKVLS